MPLASKGWDRNLELHDIKTILMRERNFHTRKLGNSWAVAVGIGQLKTNVYQRAQGRVVEDQKRPFSLVSSLTDYSWSLITFSVTLLLNSSQQQFSSREGPSIYLISDLFCISLHFLRVQVLSVEISKKPRTNIEECNFVVCILHI